MKGLVVRFTTRFVASCMVAALALLAVSVSPAAARKPITGKLSQPGYTVIALAASGKAASARTRRGSFRLRPPADTVTLHLRAANGVYSGPIVVGEKGDRALEGSAGVDNAATVVSFTRR